MLSISAVVIVVQTFVDKTALKVKKKGAEEAIISPSFCDKKEVAQ